MLRGWANEYWMPALTGLLFAPLLIICVAGLAVMPPPSAEDERLRVAREQLAQAELKVKKVLEIESPS